MYACLKAASSMSILLGPKYGLKNFALARSCLIRLVYNRCRRSVVVVVVVGHCAIIPSARAKRNTIIYFVIGPGGSVF